MRLARHCVCAIAVVVLLSAAPVPALGRVRGSVSGKITYIG
jgi:hypothetical protein